MSTSSAPPSPSSGRRRTSPYSGPRLPRPRRGRPRRTLASARSPSAPRSPTRAAPRWPPIVTRSAPSRSHRRRSRRTCPRSNIRPPSSPRSRRPGWFTPTGRLGSASVRLASAPRVILPDRCGADPLLSRRLPYGTQSSASLLQSSTSIRSCRRPAPARRGLERAGCISSGRRRPLVAVSSPSPPILAFAPAAPVATPEGYQPPPGYALVPTGAAPPPAPIHAVPAPALAATSLQLDRVRAILNHPEAVGREALAKHLALESDLPAAEAVARLAASARTPSSPGASAMAGASIARAALGMPADPAADIQVARGVAAALAGSRNGDAVSTALWSIDFAESQRTAWELLGRR